MELAPHLHRIGNDIVAAYLVDDASGVTVIDAGLPGHWRDLLAELALMGRSLDDVRGLILTHGDSDHIGFAERLRREKNVPVYVHAADAARAQGKQKGTGKGGSMRIGATAGFLWYALRKGGARTHYLRAVVPVQDGDVLSLPGSPRIVGLPGHSAGSIAVHVPQVDAIFVGDALTTRHVLTGASGPQPAPFTDDPESAARSHQKLAEIPATWVLPGHGTPWNRGTAELARALASASGH
ncbi:MBL fold metallo-hydrolase [Rathayibacter sp. YIM 133350]|uniref:MBL fold metallo-hydrolase n=1 Tax=Rathayibacter sp. YIM 133350 TaxID=3131992 RepID=UPI00307D6027